MFIDFCITDITTSISIYLSIVENKDGIDEEIYCLYTNLTKSKIIKNIDDKITFINDSLANCNILNKETIERLQNFYKIIEINLLKLYL